MLNRFIDHPQFVQQQGQLLVRRHRVHIEGKAKHPSRNEGIDPVETFDLGLRISFALLADVAQRDLMPSKIDRVKGLLNPRQALFQTRVFLADRGRKLVR